MSSSNPIREALAVAPALLPSDVALLLRDRYDTAYGIYNHDAPTEHRPLALLAQHPKEDTLEGSLLYERLNQFIDNDVYKFTGVSWDKFTELPTHMCDRMVYECNKRKLEHDKTMGEISDRLRQGMGDKQ